MELSRSAPSSDDVQSPHSAPAHLSMPSHQDPEFVTRDSDDEREATELRDIGAIHPTSATGSVSSANTLQRFWKNNVKLSVPHAACRDHLGSVYLTFCQQSVTADAISSQ
nr:hypothetical protein CFP56_52231 [Quercus suber]